MQTENEQDAVLIVLATSNRDKVREIRPLLEHLSHNVRVTTLCEIGSETRIDETETTLEGNARLKAETIFALLSERYPWLIALADDTGLEVAALDGAPGVYSARYAPVDNERSPTYEDNVRHLLAMMRNERNREASFRTVIAMKGRIPGSNGPVTFEKTVEGSVKGEITRQKTGDNGFGYDPVFWVNSAGATFAQMSTEEKNSLSHRSRAVLKAVNALGAVFEKSR
ncbi:non-canonical purine NTP pyrophosphatase, RdgB/HAM1 family [Prosthecochloris sp. GSB1]|uniref:RdgB/HAM1 family non-canonical purine NTP pyrophosphatase n=1 Tax=Prosthecochloris sp. GSB1 TaxID=281093 RepID=UPI000B8D0680|nr:RdgB/HAM1 family non-canonical purine NTP pyrophosphatase [Prosthecochloris sp. GSB1]ASQ89990.1 non-canonical purine NTP pyrophosphatase, RdgB/HAM1 family [Prosthecochloris sp. GSB1]